MISPDIQRLLREHQIDVYLKDDKLAVRPRNGPLSDDVLAQLRMHRTALTEWLRLRSPSAATPIVRGEATRPTSAAASISQQALWAVSELGAGGDHYAIPLRVDLEGSLDQTALQRAFVTLVRRHEALRTTFRVANGNLMQQVSNVNIALEISGYDNDDAALQYLIGGVCAAPFDLAKGPLFRGHLVRLSATRHILLLAGHHMVLDGASVGILLHELAALYRAEVTGDAPDLPGKPVQFLDYIDWHNRMEATDRHAAQRQYWKDTLSNAPITHNMPLDYPRPSRQSYDGARLDMTLDADLSAALLGLARAQGTTPFALMLAAFGLLLARYSGETDLVLSTPVANRNRPEFENTVGFLANVLPLRLQLDPEQPFDALLQGVQQQLFTAFDHQDVAFERIVEVVNPIRNISHTPLSQIMIAMDDFVADSFMMHDVIASLGPLADATAKVDLQLSVRMQEDRIGLHWSWASALFSRETMTRLSNQFAALLAALVQSPTAVAADLAQPSSAELAELLALGRGDICPYDPAELCHDLFSQLAATSPAAEAIRDRCGTISYGDMDGQATRLAHYLAKQMPKPGAAIAIISDRSRAFVIAQLGILKAGHVFVPIAPDCPAERLAGILEDAGIALVLTGDGVALPVMPDGVQVLNISRPLPDVAGPVTLPVRQPDDAAYIVFTSGSTGRPKGAIVPHRGLRNMTLPQVNRYAMTPDSVMTVSANVAFDSILWEIWPTLVSGGCLVMTPDAALADPALLSRHICAHRPTHFWLPTGMLELFCSLDMEWPDSIGMVFTGGDRLLRNCLPTGVAAGLVNIYGPTECSVWASCHDVLPNGPEPAPIGRPLCNTAIFILDDNGRLLPRGAVGEIVIAGDGVGLGYLGRPDLTEKAFLDVADHVSGCRHMYRSGDLGKWREDGTIDCLGRIDMQVKIRGFRVEPAEIASAIMALEGVAGAFVYVDERGAERRLVAFVVPHADASTSLTDNLRRALVASLPAYMVPGAFILLEDLPLTPNGKIDRPALIEILAELRQTDQVNTASPRDQIELAIYKIWRETLLNEAVGIGDNFFDVGGTSISAIKVIAAINTQLRAGLVVTDLFQNATIESLAALVRQAAAGGLTRPELIDLKAGEHDRNVVCVHPAGGTAFCYLSLSKLLGADTGVFGIQAPGLNAGEPTLPDLTAMAKRNVGLITHLLDRPLVLTGASFGGTLGFEMVRLLAEAGHDRCSVVMLDTEGIDDPDILKRIQPVTPEVFREKLVRYNGMYPGIDEPQIARYHQIYNHHLMLQRDYAPAPNAGRCVLLQACDDTTPAERLHGQDYWKSHCTGELLFHDSPGNHATMLEAPAVNFVAQIVTEELEAL